MIDQFHFLRPWWWLALLPLAWVVWRYWQRQQRGGAWQNVCDAHLLQHLLMGSGTHASRTPIILSALAGLLMIFALAGPVWSRLPQPVYHNSAATVVLLNLSQTMNASDVTPTRLERAKLKLLDFLREQREGQTALITYAGEAYVVSPLTDDAATIESLVTALQTNIMPVDGNNLAEALRKADALLDQDGVFRGGRILLISDDAGDKTALNTAAELQHKGRILSVLGVGTEQGAPIAASGGGFIQDRHGAILIPMLNRAALQKLAATGHGHLVMLTTTDDDLNNLWPRAETTRIQSSQSGQQHAADVWREEGPWVLLGVLPLLALLWRQGWLVVIVMAVMLQPHPVQASAWANLWARPDQQAYHVLQHGNAKAAAKLFKDPHWRSVAEYRAGNYTAAAAGFGNDHTPDALYNQGNALARAGKLQAAVQNYREVLQQQPTNADAQHNLKIVEDLLKHQQQQQNTKQNKQGGKSGQQQSQNTKQGQAGQHTSQNSKQGQAGQQSSSNAKQHQSGQGQSQTAKQNQAEQTQSQQTKTQQASQNQTGQSKSPQHAEQQSASAGEQQDKSSSARQNVASEQKNAEQAKQAKQQQAQQQANAATAQATNAQATPAVVHDNTAKSESTQALQQWLRRIPDDPGGLLRRKFMMQHQQREQATSGSN